MGPSLMSAISRFFLAALLALWFVSGRQALAQEIVAFPSLDGALTGGAPTQLHGLLLRPAGPGPFPAVVALHGCTGLFDKQGELVAREAAWGRLLTARGYVVLFPDSFGPRDVARDCEGRVRPWVERSYDAYGALRYLQSQAFVIGERIGLIGWSHGGATVTFAIAPTSASRPPDLSKGDFRVAVAFYPAWCWLLGVDWTTAIPLLLEIGALDDSTPAGPCVERVRSAIDHGSPAQMKVYDGAFHDFDWPGDKFHSLTSQSGKITHYGENEDARADALVRVPAFLDSYLKP
jgi:dienelactone hydrolase